MMSVPTAGVYRNPSSSKRMMRALRIHSSQFRGAHMASDFHGTDDHGLLTASLERLAARIVGGQKTVRLK